MMTRRIAVFAAALLASACVNSPPADDPEAAETDAAAVPVASTDEILGQWDIVSFEGYRPSMRLAGSTRAAFADFGQDGVRLRIECNWSGASGRVRNGRFVPDETGPRMQTAMGCGKERESRDARLFGFFDLSPTVERLADGRLRVAADGRELILQRPAERRLQFLPSPHDLQGEWRLQELTNYIPAGGYSAVGLSEVPGRIVVAGERIGYSRCPQYDFTFRYTDDGRLQKVGGPDLPATAVGCGDLAKPSWSRDFPTMWKVMEVLHGSPVVERSGDRQLQLRAGQYAIEITQAPCLDGESCSARN